jgi:tetratricopeptide (TPR) repeat protein
MVRHSSTREHHSPNSRSSGFQGLSFLIIALVACIAYANALPNKLTLDDKIFSSESRQTINSISELDEAFTSDIWASMGRENGLYRPFLLLSVSFDALLFGDWYVGFHISNILLHVFVCLAVFGLIRYLLTVAHGIVTPAVNYAALLSALIFAVHPIHAEVVNSVFNRSDMLVTLGIVGGLWWFLPARESKPLKAWIVIFVLSLAVLLCKETGIALPPLAVLLIFITSTGDWRHRLGKCVPALGFLAPLAIYFYLRMNALGGADVPSITDVVVSDMPPPHSEALGLRSLGLRSLGFALEPGNLTAAIKIWFDSWVIMIWPHPLFVFHPEPTRNFWLALCSQLALLAIAVAGLFKRSTGLFIGLAFFYIGILPSSRIISEPGAIPNLAERYLYLPSVGLAIVLATGLFWLTSRFSLRIAALCTVAIATILTPHTRNRNAQWASSLSLLEADYRKANVPGKTLNSLLVALRSKGDLSRANQLCNKHSKQKQENWYLSSTCGQIFESRRQFDKAERAYILAMNDDDGKASAHYSLAALYFRLNRNEEARDQFALAIALEEKPFKKEYIEADMLMKFYPTRRDRLLEAKGHLEKAQHLQPHFQLIQRKLDKVDRLLESLDGKRN